LAETNVHEYKYLAGHEFEGIIHELTKECGGNVHLKGIVDITSSGDGRNKAYQIADHGWNSYWVSTNIPNSWICFDFKYRSVALTHYTLKSNGDDGWFLLAWVMEGSNDVTNWTTLDTRNTGDLKGIYVVKNFGCSSGCSEFFRYIRLRQTAKNSSGTDHLIFCNIEFFGSLKIKL
jgi:hypothetical protein